MTNPDTEPADEVRGKAGRPDKSDKRGQARGRLVLDVGGVETALPPGHAVALAVAACGGTVDGLTVDAVRDAAPDPVQVCDAVTLRAYAGGDDDKLPEGSTVPATGTTGRASHRAVRPPDQPALS